MIKSIKVRLNPNNKQFTKLFQYAGCSRFAYNWAIAKQQENYKQGNKFLSDNEFVNYIFGISFIKMHCLV